MGTSVPNRIIAITDSNQLPTLQSFSIPMLYGFIHYLSVVGIKLWLIIRSGFGPTTGCVCVVRVKRTYNTPSAKQDSMLNQS